MVEIIKRLAVGTLSHTKETDMPEILEWRVVRPHEGDRWYDVGDTRKGSKVEFAHLIPNVLVPIDEDVTASEDDEIADKPKQGGRRSKAETSAKTNKAEGAATVNKAEPGQSAS